MILIQIGNSRKSITILTKETIKYLGLNDLSRAQQMKITAELEDRIADAILLELLKKMSEDDQRHYLDLLDADQEDRAWSFLEERVSDAGTIMRETSKKVVEDFKKRIGN